MRTMTTIQHPSKSRTYTVEELWSLVEAFPLSAAGSSRKQAMEQLAAALGLPLAPEPPRQEGIGIWCRVLAKDGNVVFEMSREAARELTCGEGFAGLSLSEQGSLIREVEAALMVAPKLPARVHAGPFGCEESGLYDEALMALVTCDPTPNWFSSIDLATRRAFMIEAGRRYNACGEVLKRMRSDGFAGSYPEVLEEILRILREGGKETP
jgi:hypothetical protein